VRCVAWSPDGKTLATGGFDHAIRFWDAAATRRLRPYANLGKNVTSLSYAPDSAKLLYTRGAGTRTGFGPQYVCALLDLKNKQERVRFLGHANTVQHGALSPDGRWAATTGGDAHETFVWSTRDGAVRHCLMGKGRPVWSVGWSKDGDCLAWGHTWGSNAVNHYGQLERSLRISTLAMDGEKDLTAFGKAVPHYPGGWMLRQTDRGKVSVRNGRLEVAALELEDDEVLCYSMVDQHHAAIGGSFGLYLFDIRSGECVRTYQGHHEAVWSVAPSPDRRYLASASSDQTVRVWRLDRDLPLLSIFRAGDDWIAWTPEGYYAASPSGERLIGWQVTRDRDQMPDYFPAGRFHDTLYRPEAIKLLLKTGDLETALKDAGKKEERPVDTAVTIAAVLPPEVKIVQPERGGRQEQGRLEVRACGRSRQGKQQVAMRLFIDGEPCNPKNRIPLTPPDDTPPANGVITVKGDDKWPASEGWEKAAWKMDLKPGVRHKLVVRATAGGKENESDPLEVTFGEPIVEEKSRRLLVRAIGVSQYADEKLRLDYAAKDAKDIEQVFKETSTGLFSGPADSQVLTDGRATRDAILGQLVELRKSMKRDDFAVLFFSGHGFTDDSGSFYLAPHDVKRENLVGTGLAWSQVRDVLSKIKGKVLVLLDTCHAGAIEGGRRRNAEDELAREVHLAQFGVAVMCSSQDSQPSEEDLKRKQGVFTLAVLEGLRGKADGNNDGIVFLPELDAYVMNRVKELTSNRQHPVTSRSAPFGTPALSAPSKK
jgi:hypothetical protein